MPTLCQMGTAYASVGRLLGSSVGLYPLRATVAFVCIGMNIRARLSVTQADRGWSDEE